MKKLLLFAFLFISALAFSSEAGVKNQKTDSNSPAEKQASLPILNRWNGDYPTAQLDHFKEWPMQLHAGYFGDEAAFASFWKNFKPSTAVPRVDFTKNLVVFVRGDGSYQHMFIAKVTLRKDIAEIVAPADRSASTPEDSFAMALAVIPRAGVKFLRVGNEQTAVE